MVVEYSVSAKKYAAARAAFRFKDVRMLEKDSRRASPEIYVIIVGESSRRSNWSLFGYPRSTTPSLDAIRDELVTVDHLTSNATVTALSVAQALTRASPASWWKASSEKSIITLLRQAGFSVFWISNQERFGAYASLISTIALDANSASYTEELPQSVRTDRFDSNLLTRMDGVLQTLSENGKTVIFLHMMGSHLNYADRYPSAFDVFHGSADAPRNLPDRQSRVINEYDNTLRFTDYVVRGVIDRLTGCRCRAAMIYFSDHGERLFDSEDETGADFGHGFSTISREEIAIPFFIWMAPQYLAANPVQVATSLKKNSQVYSQLHNLFETVVDLTGVDYQGRADSLSLFSSDFQAPHSLEFLNIAEHPVSLPLAFADSIRVHPSCGRRPRECHSGVAGAMMGRDKLRGFRRLVMALVYSWQGLCSAWRDESAFRQEVVLALLAVPAALYFGRRRPGAGAVLIAPVFLVLIVELLNSSIEAIVDRAGTDPHPLAAMAKDMASAAVMLSLFLLGGVWFLVLVDHLRS